MADSTSKTLNANQIITKNIQYNGSGAMLNIDWKKGVYMVRKSNINPRITPPRRGRFSVIGYVYTGACKFLNENAIARMYELKHINRTL